MYLICKILKASLGLFMLSNFNLYSAQNDTVNQFIEVRINYLSENDTTVIYHINIKNLADKSITFYFNPILKLKDSAVNNYVLIDYSDTSNSLVFIPAFLNKQFYIDGDFRPTEYTVKSGNEITFNVSLEKQFQSAMKYVKLNYRINRGYLFDSQAKGRNSKKTFRNYRNSMENIILCKS